MTRHGVSRLLLFVLCGLAAAFVVHTCADGEARGGFVDFGGGWEEDELRHEAFRLHGPARLAVAATGSFETDSTLAAYGWIVRRADRAVVWQMTAQNAARERGTLAAVADTVALDAGTYDAYFATYGDPLLPVAAAGSVTEWMVGLLRFGNRPWESDKSKWAFRLDLASPDVAAERLTRSDDRDATPAGPGLLWAGGPAGRHDHLTYSFAVEQPVTLRLEALGELFDGPADYGWIDDLASGERVWTMTRENTEPAGGSIKNRRFSGTLTLGPGLYRAAYASDGSHHAGGWTANPPLDPAAYGLFLYTDTPDRVAAFDPWSRLPRLVEITGVGDDALETATFTLTDSLRVWIYALGEMRRNSPYDHAWLIHDGDPGSGDPGSGSGTGGTVWKMDYDATRHAGGEQRNRVEEARLLLAPGTYSLYFESDDSHSPARWHGAPPEHPDRWGVTLFAVEGDASAVSVTRLSEREAAAPAAPLPPSGSADLPIRLAPLGNGQHVRRTFTLDDETTLRLHAVGEILLTDRFDYGWISDERADDLVWEMTRSNTEPAGGARKNRQFRGTVTLPAGTYTVHFQTDGSHAFGDFSQGSPADPSAWGITVERADAPPEPPAPPDLPALPDAPDADAPNTTGIEA